MSEISNYILEDNFMDFIRFITEKIQQAEEYVWLYIDQYPILAKEFMKKSVEKGVKYRIIEMNENLEADKIFDKKNLVLREETPSVEIKICKQKDVYLFISDKGSAISFPSREGFDYTGFVNEDGSDCSWIKELFLHYWLPTDSKLPKCSLCEFPIRSNSIIEVIGGKEYIFDTHECVLQFKRLKQIYGERFS
jgi:predicted transcriptional regulator